MDENMPQTADWAPGTLDKTRKAIGDIGDSEAQRMIKKLGGQVMYEKTSHNGAITGSRGRGTIIRNSSTPEAPSTPSPAPELQPNPSPNRKNQEELPPINAKFSQEIDRLMMSEEYNIKPNYGFFNFIKLFKDKGKDQISSDFCNITLKIQIENLQGFVTVIKTLIQIAPASYKAKIATNSESKFKFLRTVANWNLQSLKLASIELANLPEPYVVQDLIPYVRHMYRLLLQLYYYGDNKISKLIKDVYTDENQYPDAPHDKLTQMAKEAITQWMFIQNDIIKRLYPLLMRMSSDTFAPYPEFFKSNVSDILKFVGLHKYDLLLPDKPKEEEPPKEEKKPEPKVPPVPKRGAKDSIVNTGLTILEQLFPGAGFSNLEKRPDMYPYFEPLYNFDDSFKLLSPDNPVQVTIILLRIIEDCFTGCRNIEFNVKNQSDDEDNKKESDSIIKILDDWSGYRETLFDRFYCPILADLVNQIYTKKDYENSRFGKKTQNELLWQVNYHFLPHFKFTQLVLERPTDDSKMIALYLRTDFARKYLTETVSQCDAASKDRSTVMNLKNPWNHYTFDIPNEISKRLDVLLGANNMSERTNANNANLIKYTLCILSVLDWWINNEESPAYSYPTTHIYRIDKEDGKPQFSVPERHDQNKLFVEAVKQAYQKKAQSKAQNS